jgi:hypothetical protein
VPAFQPLPGASWSYPAFFTLVVSALALSLYRLKRHDLLGTE